MSMMLSIDISRCLQVDPPVIPSLAEAIVVRVVAKTKIRYQIRFSIFFIICILPVAKIVKRGCQEDQLGLLDSDINQERRQQSRKI